MQSATSKLWATSVALALAVTACSSGRELHGTREDLPGGRVLQMKLMSPMFGWVVTDRRFVSTKDAGKTWNDLTPVDAPGNSIHAAFFLDENHVWCAAFTGSAIEIYRSDTRGRSWKKTELTRTTARPEDVRIVFDDLTHGQIFVTEGDVYGTSNSGASWSRLGPIDPAQSQRPGSLPLVSQVDTDTRMTYEHGGFILTRSGRSTTLRPSGLPDTLGAISFPTVSDGWAVSGAGCPRLNGACEPERLFATSDGGATWARRIP